MRTGTCVVFRYLFRIALIGAPGLVHGETLTLQQAIESAEANNRAIRAARLERDKALTGVKVARTYRLPAFSVAALGSQSLASLGLTFPQGSLGVYPGTGPIPGESTTLSGPLQPAGIFYASVTQPLSQQHKIGLGIQLARVGADIAGEAIRSKRLTTVNEVRRLYYGVLQAESGQRSLQATVEFLKQLDQDTGRNVVQRVALHADSLDVKAQLAQAEFALLKLQDPLETQKQELNRLMGRDPDTPFEIDPLAATDLELPDLKRAYATAIESRPEVRLARLQVKRAELDRRIKRAERIPDVSLAFTSVATVNLSSILPNRLSVVGVQVTWDVYDWGRKREQAQVKRLAEQQASLDVKDTEARIIVEVAHQYRKLIEARKEVEVAQASQSARRELLRVTRNRYGQRDVLLSDVLKAQSGLSEADNGFTHALLNLATAQADFEKALGVDQ
ncbi:MAG: TolC family protein [Acidobacteria bacterium]|nr:TolC family protein [Acidobacteriota bacterium]